MTASLRSWASALDGSVSGASILCPGPGHSRKDRSLSVRLIASAPDGFLVYSHAGDDFADCRNHVRSRVGMPAFAPQIGAPASMPYITKALEPAPNIDYARRIWCEAADIRGTIAERYLNSRHLILDDSDWYRVLRFHPDCPFGSERAPAMIALMRDVLTDEQRCIQRTRLTPRKIDRQMLGPAKGSAIKIDADADVTQGLCIAEGLETGLSGRLMGLRPVWALGSAGAIAAFPVLPGIDGLHIFGEHDESGTNQRSIQTCADRWLAAGRDVLAAMPDIGKDLN
jgi:putative DNA primase/helicase